jgi:lysophospholipase L1-like esterase
MKFIHKYAFYIIVISEIISILTIGHYLYIRYRKPVLKANILGESTTPKKIKIKYENCNKSTPFKYYCEPIKNTIWEEKPSWLDKSVSYNINSNGFNSTINYEFAKKADTFRIMAIGDSHTFGIWVNTMENYPSILENLLNNSNGCGRYKHFEVLNLSLPADDVAHSTYRYKTQGEIYQPDLIIWYIKADDFFENEDEIFTLQSECAKKSISNDTVYCGQKGYDDYYKTANYNLKLADNFKAIKDFSNSIPNKILFFMYKDEEKTASALINTLKNNHIYTLNNLSYGDIPRFAEGHPNTDGYKLIAEVINNYILSDIIKCR